MNRHDRRALKAHQRRRSRDTAFRVDVETRVAPCGPLHRALLTSEREEGITVDELDASVAEQLGQHFLAAAANIRERQNIDAGGARSTSPAGGGTTADGGRPTSVVRALEAAEQLRALGGIPDPDEEEARFRRSAAARMAVAGESPGDVAQRIRTLVPSDVLEHWPVDAIGALHRCAEELEGRTLSPGALATRLLELAPHDQAGGGGAIGRALVRCAEELDEIQAHMDRQTPATSYLTPEERIAINRPTAATDPPPAPPETSGETAPVGPPPEAQGPRSPTSNRGALDEGTEYEHGPDTQPAPPGHHLGSPSPGYDAGGVGGR